MNGIEKITARIESDAHAAADAALAEAKAQCAAVRAEYEKKAEALYRAEISAAEADCARAGQRAQGAAGMENKKQTLALKQEMVSAAFSRAGELLADLPQEKAVDFLAKQAASAAKTGHETLVFNARDREKLGTAVTEKANALLTAAGKTGALTLSAETRPFCGGVILSDGDVEANCTIETLTEACREEMAYRVAGILFGD